MKKAVVIGVALGLAFGLAGCTEAGTEDDPKSGYNVTWVDTHDGRVVWCLQSGHALSCDWDNAK